MNILHYTPRPDVRTLTRWTGDNKFELESHYNANFAVDGGGNLVISSGSGAQFAGLEESKTIPEGHWFSDDMIYTTVHIPDEDLSDYLAVSQTVSSPGPLKYGVSED